jgi:TPR repeat protein
MKIFRTAEDAGGASRVEAFPPRNAPARTGNSDIRSVENLQKIDEVAVALPRYRKAAQMGDATAAYWLGALFQVGVKRKGIYQDLDQAAWWYRRAGELEHVEAQYNLALLCEKRGDMNEASEWYARATTQGHALARSNLHINAGLGHATAQLFLGLLYLSGQGVTKDKAHAARLCRKAAEQGHGYAQYALGTMYADGMGVTKDYAEAAHWLMKAAKHGETAAREKLFIVREKLEAESRRSTSQASGMTRQEALEVLDLTAEASNREVQASYIRLMQRIHPDSGGSNYFAKKLNAARQILLDRTDLDSAAAR